MDRSRVKEEVRRLWTLCFDDAPAFVDLYFARRYRDALNHTVVRDGRVAAALQIVPYPMTWAGDCIATGYLSGVCTHPDYRGRGLMRELLADTHRAMYREGYVVATLIPATRLLGEAYARAGYAPVFGYGVTRWEGAAAIRSAIGDGVLPSVTDYREAPEGVFHYLETRMGERRCCVQHGEADFRVVLEDLYQDGGRLWVARHDGRAVGVAFAVHATTGVRINELLADTPQARAALLLAACRQGQGQPVEVIRPVTAGEAASPLGMMRIVDAERVLGLYAAVHPEVNRCWAVCDEAIAANNACYTLRQGVCTREAEPVPGAEPIDIASLTSLVWADERPYMSLMLN